MWIVNRSEISYDCGMFRVCVASLGHTRFSEFVIFPTVLRGVVACVAMCGLWVGQVWAQPTASGELHRTSTSYRAPTAAVTHLKQAYLVRGIELSSDAAQGAAVTLPDAWNSTRPQRSGVFTYTVVFDASSEQVQNTQALYIPRLGNRYQLWINGSNVINAGELDNVHEDYAHKPVFVRLPMGAIQAGANRLSIVIAGEAGRYAGLSSVYFGDYPHLLARYETRHFFQTAASIAIMCMCAAIGLLALAIGVFAKNRHFVLFGVGALAWALRTSYAVTHYVPFDYRFFMFAYDALYALAVACLVLTISYEIKLRNRWVLRAMGLFLMTQLVLCALHAMGAAWARGLFLQLLLLMVAVSFALYVKQCWVAPKRMSYLLLIAFACSLSLGVYDQLMVFQFKNGFEVFALSRYSFLITALALSAMFGTRFAKLNASLARNHQRVNSRLKNAKMALNLAFERQLHEQKATVLQQERWRMMQDMHDGLGGRLVHLQQAVSTPGAAPAGLALLVKQALDELRMTVNATGVSHAQVSYMLGSLRERLDTLCAHYGKKLAWDVADIPELPQIDEVKIAALEKMILEIFTNIAKHSNAGEVKLSAGYQPHAQVWVRVIENGSGFQATRPAALRSPLELPGKGLKGLNQRAIAMGAALNFSADGCEIEVILPCP